MMEMDSDKKVTFHPDPGATHGDPASVDSASSKPRSVQEWLEQNDTRANAGLEIAVSLSDLAIFNLACLEASGRDSLSRGSHCNVFVDVICRHFRRLQKRQRYHS